MRNLARKTASRVLGYQVGPGTTRFLRNLGWIGFAFAASKVIASAAPILAARLLGPAAFGNASLSVQSVGQFYYLMMLFGMNVAVVRYGAGKAEPGAVIAACLVTSATLSCTVWVAVFAFPSLWARAFGVNEDVVWISLRFAALFAVYTLVTSILQALERFKARGLAEVALAVLLLPGLLLGGLVAPGSYQSLVLAYILAYGLAGALFLPVAFRG